MTKVEALKLCAELGEMIGDGPGDIPGCKSEIARIALRFKSHSDGYVREKAREATHDLEIWRSPRKWQQWGDDPTRFAAIVRNSIAKLDGALSSHEHRSRAN